PQLFPFLLSLSVLHRVLLSFPTRRSSDLEALVELFLDAGADPNTTMRGGETALMTAARTGKSGPVKLLLARGADVNAKERRGQTDRKSTRLNSSHRTISYAVFCLKQKKVH